MEGWRKPANPCVSTVTASTLEGGTGWKGGTQKGDGYIASYDFKYEPEAMRNEPIPPDLAGIDLLAYYALCYIYRLYKDKAIDRPTGTQMKQSLLRAYELANRTKDKYDFDWARLEQSAKDYAMNPTKETADAFYAAVYGLPLDWRNERNKGMVKDVPWGEMEDK